MIESKLARKEDLEILSWLTKITSQEKLRGVLRNHQEGTGEFLLKSQKFMDWLDRKDRILWCIGPREYH
jgi:hypothetical protein